MEKTKGCFYEHLFMKTVVIFSLATSLNVRNKIKYKSYSTLTSISDFVNKENLNDLNVTFFVKAQKRKEINIDTVKT